MDCKRLGELTFQFCKKRVKQSVIIKFYNLYNLCLSVRKHIFLILYNDIRHLCITISTFSLYWPLARFIETDSYYFIISLLFSVRQSCCSAVSARRYFLLKVVQSAASICLMLTVLVSSQRQPIHFFFGGTHFGCALARPIWNLHWTSRLVRSKVGGLVSSHSELDPHQGLFSFNLYAF